MCAQVVGRAPVLSGDAAVAEAAAAAAAAEPRSTSKYYLGLEQLELRRKDMEIRPALSNGLVSDWDSLERLWFEIFDKRVEKTIRPVVGRNDYDRRRRHRRPSYVQCGCAPSINRVVPYRRVLVACGRGRLQK